MKVIRFEDPIVFQERIEDYLIRDEAENNLPLGILNNIISGEYPNQTPYMACVDQEGEVKIAAICTPPFPTIVSYHDPPPPDEILDQLLSDLVDFLGDRLAGISGNRKLAARMKSLWEGRSGRGAKHQMAMRIYKLVEVQPLPAVPGRLRPARMGDRELMVDWYARFLREAERDEPAPQRVLGQVTMYLEADPMIRGLYFWEEDGEPVSMAGYAGPTPNGIRIGAVYTPPGQRNKGYASAVTAGVSQHLLDVGYQFVFLFTDLLNPTSNHIYQQIGYQPVCDVDRYDFN